MWKISFLTIFTVCAIGLTSCTSTNHKNSEPAAYPYGSLTAYRQLGPDDLYMFRGVSVGSSGITILNADARTLRLEVKHSGESHFRGPGMFRVEADGKGLTPNEESTRSASDSSWVVPSSRLVTYALPDYYEKIVINFYNASLDNFLLKVTLEE